MDKRTIIKLAKMSFAVSALLLFVGRGFLSHRAHGQTSTSSVGSQQGAAATSDFRHDIQEGKQQVNNDKDAQNNQREIDNEEDEKAGDQHGENEAIDGEKSDYEIEQEVENEVEQEGDQGDGEGSATSSVSGSASSTEGD